MNLLTNIIITLNNRLNLLLAGPIEPCVALKLKRIFVSAEQTFSLTSNEHTNFYQDISDMT